MKGLYKDDVHLYSKNDENAVINPARMAEEAKGAAVVSSILGGGQMAVQSGINAAANKALGKNSGRETPTQTHAATAAQESVAPHGGISLPYPRG